MKSRKHVFLDYEPSLDATPYHLTTNQEISTWILQEHGLEVPSQYVTQVKRKHGIVTPGIRRGLLSENERLIEIPSEIEAAIEAALRHFHML